MNEVLKIEVQAQVAQAQAALRQLQTSLKGTEQAAKGTTQQMPKLGQGTNQANVALVNFGRVVQDAPFGLIGIANNIDPLLSSFQQLKAQTGSTGAAFKALASSLAGPAGVAIAVSALTSSFIAFGPELKSLVSSGNQFSEAFKEASGELSATVVETYALVDAIKSGTLTTNELKSAQKQLIAINPEFKGAFSGATVNVDALNDALDGTVQKLLQAIKVSAASKILEKEFAKIAETILAAGNNLSIFQRAKIGRFGGAGIIKSNLDDAFVQLELFDERIKEVLDQLGVTGQQFIKLTEDKIKKNTQSLKNTQAELSLVAAFSSYFEEQNLLQQKKIDEQKSLNALLEIENKLRKEGAKPPELTPQQQLGLIGSDSSRGETGLNGLPKKIELAKELNESLQLSDQLINSIAGEFADLFTNLSKDGSKAFADLAKSIAQTTQRILIQYAVTQALKALLSTLTPGVGIVDGSAKLFGGGKINGLLRGGDINLLLLRNLG